jgi:hypothetical protein
MYSNPNSMKRTTLAFKCIRWPPLYMRATSSRHSTVLFLLFLLLLAPYGAVSARSVHQTNTVDIFPQGEFSQPSNWTLGAFTSFSEDSAIY